METITLEGCSAKKYEFQIYEKDHCFDLIAAIYCVVRINDDELSGIYLGITNDISTRFDNHHKQDCFDKHGITHIAIHPCNDETTRKAIEKDILCNYNFPCNEINN